MRKHLSLAYCFLFACLSSMHAQQATDGTIPKVVDAGTLLVVANGRLKGDETYRMTHRGDLLVLHSKIQYADPLSGHNLSLSGDIRVHGGNLESLEVTGYTPSGSRTHTAVTIDGSDVVTTESDGTAKQKAPAQFFAITGSLPAITHVPLLQYWQAHGSPQTLRVFPDRTVSIQFRGEDTVETSGQKHSLKRYAVTGVMWSRETMWVDSDERLIALVTHYQAGDVPTLLQVVRDGYLTSLPFFVKKAVEDDEAEFLRQATPLPSIANLPWWAARLWMAREHPLYLIPSL
jgi:hypothetical protein